MRSSSLVTRWVIYQAIITFILLLVSTLSVEKLVHVGVGEGIKASVQILKPQILKLDAENLKSYFLKNQPPFVGLYAPSGQAIYLPEDELPQNVSEITGTTSFYEKKYLIYLERLKNGFYLLGFTSQERMLYIEQYITKTLILLLILVFAASSLIAYVILKNLYRPIETLSSQMKASFDQLQPVNLSKAETKDAKMLQLIKVFNQLIQTIKNQFTSIEKREKTQKLILETLEEGICVFSEQKVPYFVNSQGYFYLKTKPHQDDKKLLRHSELGEKIASFMDQNCDKPLKEKIEDNHRFYEVTIKNISKDERLVVIFDETDRIEKLESGKTFISNASHELRTPITIIKGFAEALDDEEALKHVNLKEVMPKILSACDRMDALIKRLLLLADVDQRHIELNPFDLAACLKQETVIFQNIDPKAHISYQGPKSLMLNADEDLLKIVFSNLLSNSLKYSQEPKTIEVSLETNQDYVEMRFKDNGIGIPKTDLNKVFERFYRVDKARTRKMGGAGLGLSLVKTIIDKHRGQIFVESELGQGSTFIVRLPNL